MEITKCYIRDGVISGVVATAAGIVYVDTAYTMTLLVGDGISTNARYLVGGNGSVTSAILGTLDLPSNFIGIDPNSDATRIDYIAGGPNLPSFSRSQAAPTHSAPEGACHQRWDGVAGQLYVRENGAWVGK